MAVWDKITSSGNVEDRRGMSPLAVGGGGLGIAGVVVLLALNLFGGTGNQTLDQILTDIANSTLSSNTQSVDSGEFAGEDAYEQFASKVLGSTNETWRTQLQGSGTNYEEPRLVLFRSATSSACGAASSAVGPHYCPTDQTIYLDETFFDELKTQLGGSNDDVAQAYVLAHESGHHLQNLLGTLEKAVTGGNSASVGLELQADCYAGVWLKSIANNSVLDQGEMNEALSAAAAVGDDRIQQKVNGQINPETWTHGSSEQRMKWLNTGFDKGTISACTSI